MAKAAKQKTAKIVTATKQKAAKAAKVAKPNTLMLIFEDDMRLVDAFKVFFQFLFRINSSLNPLFGYFSPSGLDKILIIMLEKFYKVWSKSD